MGELSFLSDLITDKGGLVVLILVLLIGGRYLVKRLSTIVDNLFNRFTSLLETQHEKCEEDLKEVKKNYWSMKKAHNSLAEEFKHYREARLENIVNVMDRVGEHLEELKQIKKDNK